MVRLANAKEAAIEAARNWAARLRASKESAGRLLEADLAVLTAEEATVAIAREQDEAMLARERTEVEEASRIALAKV